VTLTLKRGAEANEMTDFRYDVVLHVGAQALDMLDIPDPQGASSEAEITDLLNAAPPVLYLQGLQNARLAPVYAARRALESGEAADVPVLRELLENDRDAGIDPGALFDLHPDYEVAWARFNRDNPADFDVIFRQKSLNGKPVAVESKSSTLEQAAAYANEPATQGDDQTQLTDQLRTHLKEHLPDYMIPSAFVAMEAFPLTPNGKIDRKALPAPTVAAQPVQTEYAPPSNELETTIAETWMELLGLSKVGRSDNIFDIGANSIMTAQANQRLSKKLGRRVSLVSMFRYPTIESLAEHLSEDSAGSVAKPANDTRKPNRREEAAAKRRAKRQERVG